MGLYFVSSSQSTDGSTFSLIFAFQGQAIYEPQHEISSNVVCKTCKGSDQPAHMHSLIRAFASRLNIL